MRESQKAILGTKEVGSRMDGNLSLSEQHRCPDCDSRVLFHWPEDYSDEMEIIVQHDWTCPALAQLTMTA